MIDPEPGVGWAARPPVAPSSRPRWARGSWNPLACGSTDLPPNLLLSGKLLALWLMVHRGPLWWPEVHLPFLSVFDALGPLTPVLQTVMSGAFLVFSASLFLNRAPRTSCLVLGVLVLLGIAMSRVTFSNNTTFAGCFLLLLGLHEPGRGVSLLRAQLAVVYFGAGLNKLLDADWRTGAFVEYWTHDILELGWYVPLDALIATGLLSLVLGWVVIATELGLAVGFAIRRLTPWAIGVGLAFHVGLLVFTGGRISWLFLYVMAAAYVAVAPWPDDSADPEGAAALGARALLRRPVVYLVVALVLLWQPLPPFIDRTLLLLGIG